MMLVAGLFLCLFLGFSGQIVLTRLLPALGEPFKEFLSFVTTILAFHGATLVLVSFFLRSHQINWPMFLGLDQIHRGKTLLWATVVGLVAVPLALALTYGSAELLERFGRQAEPQFVVQVLQVSQSLPKRILITLAAVLVAPAAEESLFRGVLYPAVKQQGYPRLALWGTALLFASIHANLMTFIPLTLFAVALVLLYEKTGMLLAPILAHAAFNAVNAFLIFFQAQVSH